MNELEKNENRLKHTNYWSGTDKLDTVEAAQYLKLSKSHLWKLTADGKIPCIKFLGRLMFDKAELDEWVERQKNRRGNHSSVALSLAKIASRKMKHRKN